MRRLLVLLAVTLFAAGMIVGCGNGREVEIELPEPTPEQQRQLEEPGEEGMPPPPGAEQQPR